ncbi:MAG: rhomboid family intramembrane serine protease [Deltaproteobacteria bacterium]|nr:MAG: rhomboid family intramembrane serine protease [Deltaproteobacteria bacterium]
MIPLRDTIPSRTVPYVNYLLIIINVSVFFYELSWGSQLPRLLGFYGLVPARFFLLRAGYGVSPVAVYLPFLSHMFFHGGWLHLLGNMLYLWIFGDNVEDRLGHGGYLLFYLFCGLGAAVVHLLTNTHSMVPTIGASGAIAGVMGAYFMLYPQARVVTLLPIFFFFYIVEIPAFFFLGFWFLLQLIRGLSILHARVPTYGGVAWWAHIGGFLFGQLLVLLLLSRRRKKTKDKPFW